MFFRWSFDFYLLICCMNVYKIFNICIFKELKKYENKKFGEGSENDWIFVFFWGNMFIWLSILIRL